MPERRLSPKMYVPDCHLRRQHESEARLLVSSPASDDVDKSSHPIPASDAAMRAARCGFHLFGKYPAGSAHKGFYTQVLYPCAQGGCIKRINDGGEMVACRAVT